jgi:hypothetical protein
VLLERLGTKSNAYDRYESEPFTEGKTRNLDTSFGCMYRYCITSGGRGGGIFFADKFPHGFRLNS